MRAADPASFAWKPPPYEYEHDKQPIDVIAGAKWFRERIDAGERAESIAKRSEQSLPAFRALRQRYLLYQ
jgi:Exo-beta-N-acetylmuramidase NamZ, C-terminal